MWIPLDEHNRDLFNEVGRATIIIRNMAFELEQQGYAEKNHQGESYYYGYYSFEDPWKVAQILREAERVLDESKRAMKEKERGGMKKILLHSRRRPLPDVTFSAKKEKA